MERTPSVVRLVRALKVPRARVITSVRGRTPTADGPGSLLTGPRARQSHRAPARGAGYHRASVVANRRDDFSPAVANKARDLVSSICSNPGCRVFTVSAEAASTGDTASVGTAAHIHAAAPGGPRYDPNQTREERRGIANALWLCATCARLIDSDVAAHPADLLRKWKAEAEQEARARIGKRATTVDEVNAEERSRITGQLDALVRQVGALAPTIQTAFTRRLDLRPPPLVAAAIARDATVTRILASVGARRWLAIHGEVAIGKTHLAVLLGRARGEFIWIRTRGVESAEAAARVEEAIVVRAGNFPETVVVDDLPPARDELADALVHLQDVVGPGSLVVSTSNHRLGPRVREYVPADSVLEEACPRLTDEEAEALLRAHGAGSLSSKAIAFLNALAHHHPALLTAISRYLKARAWVWDDVAVSALFAREHLSELNSDTVRALTESVSSEASRSLLYRLTLVRGAFDLELVSRLGAVSPALPLLHERLLDLDGLWIQRQNDERYTASPLVTSLPPTVVDEPIRIACWKILASDAMSGTMTPQALVDATLYYAQAGEFDTAAHTLSFGLVAFAFEKRRVSPGDILLLWWDAPLPVEMSGDTAVSLRSAQIAAGVRANKNVDQLVTDLSARLAGTDLSWGPVVGAGVAFQALVKGHAPTAFALLRRGLSAFDIARLPDGQLVSSTTSIRLELLAWLVVPELQSAEQITEWVALVLELPRSSLGARFGWLSFREACIFVIDGIWQREADKPNESRDWVAVKALLSSVRSAALAKGNSYLAAVATRAMMVVIAEYEENSIEAVTLAHETVAKFQDDGRAAFLVRECEGRQSLYRGDLLGARATLDGALAVLGDDQAGGLDVIHTLNAAARAVSRTSPADAVAYMQRAQRVAVTLGRPGALELARVCGELAIACEHAADRNGAFSALSAGAEALLASSRTSDVWKRTAAIFAHTTGYIARVMTTGTPPPSLPGGEPYSRPEQGVFYVASKEVHRTLRPQAMATVCVMLAEFAAAVGAHDDALRWGKRTLEEADADPSGEAPQFIALALPHMIRGAMSDMSTLADATVASLKASRARTDQADLFVLALSMIPLASEIQRLSISGDAAATACEDAARLCTEVASRVSGSAMFEAAAKVFRTAASKEGSVNDLIVLANELATSGAEAVHMIAALLASVDDRRALRAVAQAHLAVLAVLAGPSLAHVRERVMANLEQYWRGMLERAPFQFSHPIALREALAATGGLGAVASASLVVRAVADDLRVRR